MEKVLLIQYDNGFMVMLKVDRWRDEDFFAQHKIIAMHKVGSPQIKWSEKVMEKNNEKFFPEQNFLNERRQAFA